MVERVRRLAFGFDNSSLFSTLPSIILSTWAVPRNDSLGNHDRPRGRVSLITTSHSRWKVSLLVQENVEVRLFEIDEVDNVRGAV